MHGLGDQLGRPEIGRQLGDDDRAGLPTAQRPSSCIPRRVHRHWSLIGRSEALVGHGFVVG
eukprot:4125896-Prymnesium_polylepis.1